MAEAAWKLIVQNFLDLVKGDLPTVILKLFELFRPVRGDEVRAGGQDLAQLDKGGPQLFKNHPQPHRSGKDSCFLFEEIWLFLVLPVVCDSSREPQINKHFPKPECGQYLEDFSQSAGAAQGLSELQDFHRDIAEAADVRS